MPFERFTETGKSFDPRVTITARGSICFNEGARRKHGLRPGMHCVLYFDRETKRVGVELTEKEGLPGAMRLRLRRTGADIAAKSFLSFFQIQIPRTTMFDVEVDPSTGWLVLDLGKGRERNTGPQTVNIDEYDPFANE